VSAEINPTYKAAQCPQCGAAIQALEESIICQYCGTRLFRQSISSPSSPETPPVLMKGMKFSTITCKDLQGTGMNAFRLLIPTGWQFQGGVTWLNDNPGMPAVVAFRVQNPAGLEAFEVFPNQSFYWTNNPMSMLTFPIGSRYYGNEVRPPMNAQQSLRQIVLPRFYPNQQISILKEEHLPDLPNLVRTTPIDPNVPLMADGAKIRICYPFNSGMIEEEIFGCVEVTNITTPTTMGMMEMTFWFADYLMGFRGRSGQLDNLVDLFKTILTSFQLNQQWFSRVQQISRYLIQNQIQQIHNVGQLSQYISQNYDEISQSNLDGFYQRGRVMDNLADRASQVIRGVETYSDPNSGQLVELPNGYASAWSTPLGDFIISDEPDFNPNRESNQTWTPLEKQNS
jgi:hypothetical protein